MIASEWVGAWTAAAQFARPLGLRQMDLACLLFSTAAPWHRAHQREGRERRAARASYAFLSDNRSCLFLPVSADDQ